jgi:hypothetical protein
MTDETPDEPVLDDVPNDIDAQVHQPPLDNPEDAQFLDPDDPRRKAAERHIELPNEGGA